MQRHVGGPSDHDPFAGAVPPRPGGPGHDRVTETHASVLVFLGGRVYKFRKPVAFDFLDMRRREDRRADCEREVALNRRLAPDVYEGVADLVLDGRALDHAVVMRRLPAERSLAALAEGASALTAELGQVADRLARFHAAAERSQAIAAAATPEALTAAWRSNFAGARRFVHAVLDPEVEDEIEDRALRWIAGRRVLLEARMAEGHVCDGHGDLQADDVYCLDDGVRILDCLQFDDALRHVDVAADLAFLVMDLWSRGRRDLARTLRTAYEAASDSALPESLLEHYCAHRAYVRAKVVCLRMEQGNPELRYRADRLHRQALHHLRCAQVTVVLVGGLPASGKSTLATGLAGALGSQVVSSDALRRERYGRDGAAEGFGVGRYAPGATADTYAQMLARARDLVARGVSVVLDASWIDADERRRARDVAGATGCDVLELCCTVADEVAAARMARRAAGGPALSEATLGIRQAMARIQAPWPEALTVDTTELSPGAALAKVLTLLATERGLTEMAAPGAPR